MRDASTPLRVLVVDDCVDDADLLMLEFVAAGIPTSWRRVDNAAALAAALIELNPHVVLSDLNLPGYSGREAFAFVRAREPGLPFVLVTGAANDGIPLPPVDAVVLKDALPRVPDVVRGLLDGQLHSGLK